MRLIATFFLLFAAIHLTAQVPFEGKINYTLISPDKLDNAKLTIFFGKPGLRLEISETEKPGKAQETMIFNFDSGKIFTLMPNEKKFKTSFLKKQQAALQTQGKTIAGFSTKAVRTELSGMPNDLMTFFGASVLYASNDLNYPIPPMYTGNPELVMVNAGKIVLGGDFFLPDDNYKDKGDGQDTVQQSKLLFSVIADQVIPQSLNDSLFTTPAGFEKWSYDYPVDSVDSTTYSDTVAAPHKPVTKKNKKAPIKKKSAVKESAVRRKDD